MKALPRTLLPRVWWAFLLAKKIAENKILVAKPVAVLVEISVNTIG